MAAFHDVAKLEKSFSIVAPVRRHNHLKIVANAFRVLEVCLAIALFFWISAQLPVAVRTLSEYWRQILSFITRPLVVFVFFNAIVAAVASKAGRLARQTPIDDGNYYTDDFYEEMVKVNESRSKSSSTWSSLDHNNHEDDKEIIFQDKQIIISSNTPNTQVESGIGSEYSESSGIEKSVVKCPKVYRRTKSEKMSKRNQSQERQLRRSETTKLRKVGLCGDHESAASDDELNSDEFQRAIEEFIAKQLRFRREESMAIVLK